MIDVVVSKNFMLEKLGIGKSYRHNPTKEAQSQHVSFERLIRS